MRAELETYARQVLGSCVVVADRSWPHGEACVLEVCADGGTRWFAKRCRGERNYLRERTAYLEWVPVLGDRAPRLRAHDDELRAVVVSAIPGEIDTAEVPERHHQAGAVLRRFHAADRPEPDPGYAEAIRTRLDRWIARGGSLLEPRELDFAQSEINRLAELPPPSRVPCHHDYTSRNWLVDADGTLRVIDFGHARRDVWVTDLIRMWFDSWQRQPELREAFLAGYGRTMDGDDYALLIRTAALGAVSSVIWAREHDDAAFEHHHRRMLAQLMRHAD